MKRLLGFRKNKNMRQQLGELALAHEEHLETLSPKEMEMLNNIMVASRMKAEDVMVPRANIKFLSSQMSLGDVVKEVVKSPQTRYPVYDEDPDDVIGFVHSKSILWALHHYRMKGEQDDKTTDKKIESNKSTAKKASDGKTSDDKAVNKNIFSLKHLVRPVLFVSGAMPAFELLSKMKDERRHLAIVVDEYGGTDGLVTVTDLAEEVIGEMDRDIFSTRKSSLIETKDGFLVNPLMRTEEFEKKFGVALIAPVDDIDIDTVGGVVLALAGYVPQKGEKIKTRDKKITFEIKDSTNRVIKNLLVKGVKLIPAQTEKK